VLSIKDIAALATQQFADYRITPLFFPQRKLRNRHYLPKLLNLPQDLDFQAIGFGWGLFGPAPGLAALDTQNQTVQIMVPTFLWGMAGVSNDNTGPGNSNLGFNLNIFHTHNGSQYRFFNRDVFNAEVLGKLGNPAILRQPHLFLPGDSIECQVKNLGSPVAPAVTSIQVVLFAGQMSPQGNK